MSVACNDSNIRTTAAMLIPKIEPSETGVLVGGYVNVLKNICRSFSRRHNGVFDIYTCSSPAAARWLRENPIPWARIRVHPNRAARISIGFGLGYAWHILSSAARGVFRKYDCIYGHSGWAVYAWVTYLAGLISHRPAIHAIYCPFPQVPSTSLIRRLLFAPATSRFPLNRMRTVIATSRNVAISLEAGGVARNRIVVIPPAIDESRFHDRIDGTGFRRACQFGAEDKIILYVGNLLPSKGLDVLLAALPAISLAVKNFRLVVTLELVHAGFDERKAWAEEFLHKIGLRERVTFLGIVDDMPACMAAADVFVSPYRDTQGPSDFPIAAMEAMAIGKPVVGTKVGAIPELIEDGVSGYLVPSEQPQALADALIRLLTNPALARRFGSVSRERIKEKYTLEKTYSVHRDILGFVDKR